MCTVILTFETWLWVKVMTHPSVMDNNCVKYYPDPIRQWGDMSRTWFLGMCGDLWDINSGESHDTPFGLGQQLCEILSRSDLTVRRYGSNTYFGCTMTLTLEVWLLVKLITHPLDNNCVKYYPVQTWQYWVMAWTRISGMCALWTWPWKYDLWPSS